MHISSGLVALFTSFAFAQPVEFEVIRFDTVSVWKKNEFNTIVTRGSLRNNQPKLTTQQLGNTFKPFNFTLECSPVVPKAICSAANASFNRAGDRIAAILKITKTINVDAKFYPFCENQGNSCDLGNVLGQAAAAANFIGVAPSPASKALYPQALVKQVNTQYNLDYNDYDIIAEFNSEFSFWYPSLNQSITAGQYDFEYVICHELTHGLGFDTTWFDWGALYSEYMSSPFNVFLPDIRVNGADPYSPLTKVTQWSLPRIYDIYIYDSRTGTNLTTYYNNISSLYPANQQSFQNFLNNLVNSPAYSIGRALLQSVTAGAGTFKFMVKQNGSTVYIPLATPTKYSIGSSVAHLDYASHYLTPDFLMIPSIDDAVARSLDTVISSKKGISYGVYGNATVALLAQLGWPINTISTPSGNSSTGTTFTPETRNLTTTGYKSNSLRTPVNCILTLLCIGMFV